MVGNDIGWMEVNSRSGAVQRRWQEVKIPRFSIWLDLRDLRTVCRGNVTFKFQLENNSGQRTSSL